MRGRLSRSGALRRCASSPGPSMADVVIDCAFLQRSGVPITEYASLSTEDRYLTTNNGRMGVFIATGAEETTLSMTIPQTLDGQKVMPREVDVPANSLYGIGSWPADIYNDASAQVALSLTSVSGVRLFCACFE